MAKVVDLVNEKICPIIEEMGYEVVEVEYAEDKERGNGVVLKQSIASGETVDVSSVGGYGINNIQNYFRIFLNFFFYNFLKANKKR